MTMTINENGNYSVSIERGRNSLANKGHGKSTIPIPQLSQHATYRRIRWRNRLTPGQLGSIVRPHDNVMSLEFHTHICNLYPQNPCPDEAVYYTFNFFRN